MTMMTVLLQCKLWLLPALFISQSPAHHRVYRDARSRDRERGLSSWAQQVEWCRCTIHVYTSRSDRLLFRLAALRPSEGPQRSALVSFLSRVMSVSKSFFVSRAFERFGAKRSSSGAFDSDDVLEVFLKTQLRHRAFVCELRLHGLRPQVFFLKVSFLFPKQSRCYLPDRYGDPQAEQSTLVMEHRRLE